MCICAFIDQQKKKRCKNVSGLRTYRQSVGRLVETECGGQHGWAEGEARAAGIAALAAGAAG